MTKLIGIVLLFLTLYTVLLTSDPSAGSLLAQQILWQDIGFMGLLVLAVAPVIIAGGIDLSIGSALALSAVSFILLMKYGLQLPPYAAITVVLFGGAVVGFVHGLLITQFRLQPFLATLCGLFIARGLARWIPRYVTNTTGTVSLSGTPHDLSAVEFLAKDYTLGLPWPWLGGVLGLGIVLLGLALVLPGLSRDPRRLLGGAGAFCVLLAVCNGALRLCETAIPWMLVIMLALAVVLGVVLHATVYGRYLYAIGANEQAARYAGIATDRYKTLTYVWSSMLVALAGVLFILENGGANPASAGNFYELYAITGAVLGGCSLRGGEGTIVGIALGAAILPLLQKVILFARIPDDVEPVVVGSALLLGTMLDEILKRRSAARQ